MRILLTVDPEIPVPPKDYGGIERIVDALIDSFSRHGNEVYLIAHPDSTNQSTIKTFPWPALKSRGLASVIKNAFFLTRVTRTIEPDIIHSFSRLLYLYPIFLTSKTPILQSYQRAISEKSTKMASILARNKLRYTSCGYHMVKGHSLESRFTPVHNFTDIKYFNHVIDKKPEHLMYLGRIEEIKGAKEAIQVAIITNHKLIIAGNIQSGHESYFIKYIKPHLDNPLISYVGPVNDEQKRFYLQKSKAFLFPIKWEEPFGIVMAEAMACGVPVIGFNRGSVPEVVKDGKTGFVVNSIEQMIEAVKKIEQIDPAEVRRDCEKRFSLEQISKQYISIFGEMLDKPD